MVMLERLYGKVEAFYMQCLWSISRRVEVASLHSFTYGTRRADTLKVEPVKILDVIDHPNRLRVELERHIATGVRASEQSANFTLTADKANVGGLNLQCGGFVWPSNQAACAIPQVCHSPMDPAQGLTETKSVDRGQNWGGGGEH